MNVENLLIILGQKCRNITVVEKQWTKNITSNKEMLKNRTKQFNVLSAAFTKDLFIESNFFHPMFLKDKQLKEKLLYKVFKF